jgi:peroxiredoxin
VAQSEPAPVKALSGIGGGDGLLPDDGGSRHLKGGRRMPDVDLPTTSGASVNFARIDGTAIVYCYPWTGRPGLPNPPHWDDIPGAHGSTPEAEGFRDLYAGFRQAKAAVYGLSTQATDYQRELVERLGLPFDLVSDAGFAFQRALALPTFAAGSVTYLKRLTLAVRAGRIERVYYPVGQPAAHAREVCAWLGMIRRSD